MDFRNRVVRWIGWKKGSYAHKAFRGALWHLLAYAISLPLAYAARILYARYLPKEEVGLFYTLYDLFGLLAIFRSLGLDQALLHYIPRFLVKNNFTKVKKAISAAFFLKIGVSITIALLIITLSPWVASFFLKGKIPSSFKMVLIVMAFGYFLFDALLTTLNSALLGFQAQGPGSLPRIILGVSIFLSALFLIFVVKFNDALVPAIGYTVYAILGTITAYIFLTSKLKNKIFFHKIDWDIIKRLLSYGKFAFLTHVGGIFLLYIDGICLAKIAGLSAVAEYKNAALPTANILIFLFSGTITPVLFPMVSEMWSKGERENLRQGLKTLSKILLIGVLPISLFLFVGAERIVSFLFGNKYLPATSPLRILSIGLIPALYAHLFSTVLNAIGYPQKTAQIYLLAGIVNFLGNIFLIPNFGSSGAALATVITYLVMDFKLNFTLKI